MENKLPTAEEFLKKNGVVGMTDLIVPLMVEFAVLHCAAQLDAILENLSMIQECGTCSQVIDTDSIINAYNLNDIK